MLVNDDGCTRNVLAFDYYYTDDQGKAQTNGITDVVNLLPDGRIVAGPRKTTIGSWKQNQWYKMACVIDPAALTMDVFINGEKKGENITLDSAGSSGHKMLSIYRFKAGKHFEGFGDRTLNGYYAFDNFKCYAGDYALRAAADKAPLASSVYNMGNPGYIRVTGTQPINTFKANLSGLDQAESYDFYDNNTLTSQNVMRMGMWHKAVALVRSQGGAFHYYEVIDETKAPVVGEMTLKNGAYEVAQGSLLEAGKYDLTLKAEKYNDTPYPLALVLALYNGSQLTGVRVKESTLAFGENTLSCSLEIAEAGENVHLKAFLWDGLGSMVPLKEAKAW